MASPVKLYQREMHENLGFFANWLPGDPIQVGDVGRLERGRFRRVSSLKELGIAGKTSTGSGQQDVQYTSTQGTSLKAAAGGTAADLAKAEITVEFSRAGAFVFHASKLRPLRLANRAAVAQELLKAYEERSSEKDWLLVEALHLAELVTVLVSEDSSAGIVLVANVSGLSPTVSLADPKISFTVASTRGRLVHIVGARRSHPLYSCVRVTDPLMGSPSVQPVRGSGGSSPEAALSRPSIDDLLNS